MVCTVKFYHQTSLMTIKIGNKIINNTLFINLDRILL